MNRSFSLWLDLIRALAAFAVLFGHMAHIRFTRGDYYFLREWNIASDAVAVFFVISGLVIAYASGRDGSLRTYAFNRLSRIYTVMVPALILTLALDSIGTRLTMEAYPKGYYQALPLGEFLFRGLTLTPLWTGTMDYVRLGSNGPIWSLSYEFAYYALFGFAVFTRGALRLVLILLTALLAGLPVMALFPAWLTGVWVWHKIQSGLYPARAMAWAMACSGPSVILVGKATGLDALLTQVTVKAFAPASHHAMLLYSDEVLWNCLIALCVAVHLYGASVLLRSDGNRLPAWAARTIRWASGGSFSLYVMHYPVLQLLDAALPETLPAYDLWLLGITLIACYAFAAVFERPLKSYRGWIKRILRTTRRIPAE